MDYLLLLAGLAGLLGGGDALVRGASGLARTLGVSPIVVGLTVVAFGTSSPELVVNVLGALSGETDIAFGNVTGSNLANLGLVLGITAVIAPILVQGQIVRREIPLLMLGSAMLLVFASDDVLRGESPMIDRADGLGLLLVFCVFVYVLAGDLIRSRGADPLFSEISEVRRFQVMRPAYRDLFWLLGGLVLLYFGGRLTIDSGSALALAWGVPSVVVGIVLIAIGTSLPELVTSVVAAYRNEPDLAVGNLVGSNIFNGLFVLPVSALIADIPVPLGGDADLTLGLLLAALLIPITLIGRGIIRRIWGVLLLLIYLAYVAARVILA